MNNQDQPTPKNATMALRVLKTIHLDDKARESFNQDDILFLKSIEQLDASMALGALKNICLDSAPWAPGLLWEVLTGSVGGAQDLETHFPLVTKKGEAFLKQVLPSCFERGFNPFKDMDLEDILGYLDTPVYELVGRLCCQHGLKDDNGGNFYLVMTDLAVLTPKIYQGAEGFLHETNYQGRNTLHIALMSSWMWDAIDQEGMSAQIHDTLATIEKLSSHNLWDALDQHGNTPLELMQQSYNEHQVKSSEASEFMAFYLKRNISSEVNQQINLPNKASSFTKKM